MIHCICLKFGTKYSADYVNKLFRGIERNTSKEFLFTCFTDNSSGITTEVNIEALPISTGDWYSKIGLYNEKLYNKEDQIFYFDLDTVITGDLDEIFSYTGDFAILQDFYRPDGYGSGLMAWRPAAVNHMWTNYTQGYKSRYGDQGWCEQQYPGADLWQQMYPEKIISYKVHIVGKGRLRSRTHTNNIGTIESSSIVCFHGRPLPQDCSGQPWMKENWK
jgi:hypothetical protein